MNSKMIEKILSDTAYVRTSGTKEELACAEYIKSLCSDMNLNAKIEAFPITMYKTNIARLVVDGKEIPCRAFNGSASKTVKGKFYYLRTTDAPSLKKCKDKIVLVNNPVNFTLYDQLIENEALGIIAYTGTVLSDDRDIDQREICFELPKDSRLPIVNVNVNDAVSLVRKDSKFAEITVEQTSYIGESHNVILDIEGEKDETIIISAHYDSTFLSTGAYDNMSSCIGLLYLAEHFATNRPKRRIRLLWCGSEERGLLGSAEYCSMHKNELKNTILNINLDMLGAVMGYFVPFNCINDEMNDFLTKFLKSNRLFVDIRYKLRSSDSSSFVRAGVPAVSFTRTTPNGTGTIHTPYDTAEIVSAKMLLTDMKIITKFTEIFANSDEIPCSIEISEKIKEETEIFFKRKTGAIKEF